MTLILAQSKQQAQAAVRDTVKLLIELGFVIHQGVLEFCVV